MSNNKIFSGLIFFLLLVAAPLVMAQGDGDMIGINMPTDAFLFALRQAVGGVEHFALAVACGLLAIAYQQRVFFIFMIVSIAAVGCLANYLLLNEFVTAISLIVLLVLTSGSFRDEPDLVILATTVLAFIGLFIGYEHGAGMQIWSSTLITAYLAGFVLGHGLLAAMIMMFARLMGQTISMAMGTKVRS